MFIAMNRFTIFEKQGEAFENRWRTRQSHLKEVPGFIKFRLLKLDETHYSSYAEWESEEVFVDWTKSEAFRKAHGGGMPEGVVDGHPKLEFWQVILDEG